MAFISGTQFHEAARRALAFALLHFVYGLYLGYSGAGADRVASVIGLGLPAALDPALLLAAAAFPVALAIDLAGQLRFIRRRAFWTTLIIAGMAGGFAGTVMVSAALDHNPQQVFLSSDGIADAPLSEIFYSWFAALFLTVTLASLLLLGFRGSLQSRAATRLRAARMTPA